ncbi:aminotransferase class I/II-fold pyridoxal phosphate-dependent enzyme [Novosphingobium colocasiae]|uniref:aminotransferase class I/II-fold pyridoxal phosphate-dependent enzyme n=1 Tax=Novosphingobium colocasiae TaxID=1256513 RepID=UPI0035B471C9
MAGQDWREDAGARGYSRRQIGRVAALLGGGLAMSSIVGERALQAQGLAVPQSVPGAVRLNANECWAGPFAAGIAAASAVLAQANRYEPDGELDKFLAMVSRVEGVPQDTVLAWPGSSDPLSRSAVTFASPTRGLVTGDPTFEVIWATGAWVGAKVSRVPLAPGGGHDVRAMLAADPDAGLFYICTPNNPTGTVTAQADIDWLLANKRADAVVLVDEAYIHWTQGPSLIRLAATRADLIVMRTFSKLFGMAGMRLGYTVAAPGLHERMMRYDGRLVTTMLPITAVACGTASLPLAAEIAARRGAMIAARDATSAHLARRGLTAMAGSEANMLMVGWAGRDPKAVVAALAGQGVQIGRSWTALPAMSRVTIGSEAEMATFCGAVDRMLAS